MLGEVFIRKDADLLRAEMAYPQALIAELFLTASLARRRAIVTTPLIMLTRSCASYTVSGASAICFPSGVSGRGESLRRDRNRAAGSLFYHIVALAPNKYARAMRFVAPLRSVCCCCSADLLFAPPLARHCPSIDRGRPGGQKCSASIGRIGASHT